MEDILQVREGYRLQQWGQIVQRCRLPALRETRQLLGTSVEAPSFLWTGDY